MPVTQNSISFNWTPGNGAFRVAYINSVNSFVAPIDGSTPIANTVWANAGQQAIYIGTGNSVTVTGLSPNTTYYGRVYEFNGVGIDSIYLTTTAFLNPNSITTLSATPTVQDSLLGFSGVGQTSFTLTWTLGNAANRAVYINSVNSFINPVNGTVPVANSTWLNLGQQAVYVGPSGNITVTGLAPNTTYYLRSYGFNGAGATSVYITTTATGNPASVTTQAASGAVAPTVQDSGIQFSGFTDSLMTITWNRGNGANSVLYLNTTNTFVAPANGTMPTADSSWNGAGQQAVYVGKGSGVQVTGLTTGVTYYARVYGFNGTGATAAYNTTGASFSGPLFTINIGSAGNTISNAGEQSVRRSILVEAEVSSSTPSITLKWTTQVASTGYTIRRKLKTDVAWGSPIATLAGGATQYVDTTAALNTYYEYQIIRTSGAGTAYGYVSTGIDLDQIDNRGKIILLVDNTYTTPLATEISQLIADLVGDGWRVVRNDFARTATVATVKAYIVATYNADPTQVKSLFILGRVAIPFSGRISPDGHSDHDGAWTADTYYADINSASWTDTTVNVSAGIPAINFNVPGDGKFDQAIIPTPVELEVGRVDLFNMPAFNNDDIELTRTYLNKLHDFKIKRYTTPDRGVVLDQLDWTGRPLAETGWRTMGPMVGANNIRVLSYGNNFLTVATTGYTWSTTAGGGRLDKTGYTDLNGGNVESFVVTPLNSVFNTSIGSYFGDFADQNNFLRAFLATGRALTNAWAGLPRWIFHHFAFSDTIGYSTKVTQNGTSLYTTTELYTYDGANTNVHLNLMGDPSLRLKYVETPSNLIVTQSGPNLLFGWAPAADDKVLGYHIYRIYSDGSPHARITGSPVAGSTATVAIGGAVSATVGTQYMVRAIRLETNRSGSYYNASIGAIASVT